MNCRDVREALDALLDGEMEAGEELAVRDHLDWCLSCAREFDDLREWHGTLADALCSEGARPSVTERRRTADAVIAAIRPRAAAPVRWAAVLAIGLSIGVAVCAVSLSRPPRDQVVRVADRLRERETRGAELRLVSEEIERDLGRAREVVAARAPEDPAARAVAAASAAISRRLGEAPPPAPQGDARERLTITRTDRGRTVTVTQLSDGRVRVALPDRTLEARNVEDLLARYGEICRGYAISGVDGFLSLGDDAAGADWRGRLDLLLRTGTWDEAAQWEAYRGWLSARAFDARDLERRFRAHQERCRAEAGKGETPAPAVDVQAILRTVQSQTRAQLRHTQEQVDAEMKRLEPKLREARELRDRARGLRIFAEDVTRD